MRGTEFAELEAFATVADRRSFVKAAAVLGISPSTLSQTVRALEERLGVRLLNRTTRSVAVTEAGERLLTHVGQPLRELSGAVEAINAFRDRPAGTLRLNVSTLPAGMVIAPQLRRFARENPEITLDITVMDGPADIVTGRFDAGIRDGRRIERDMIAVQISPPARIMPFGSPDYLARRPAPQVPQDLTAHDCVCFRQTDGAILRWEFEMAGEQIDVGVEGSLVTNNIDLAVRAALDGVGLCYMVESYMAPLVAEGKLIPVLEDWAIRSRGFFIYYTSRRQMPAPLKVFIDFMRRAGAVA
jgi:DNA-binding transcriptional LysR family regulator